MNKRLSALKESAESSKLGRWGNFRTFFLSFVCVTLFTFIFLPKDISKSEDSSEKKNWNKGLSKTFEKRLEFLDESNFVLIPFSDELYYNFGKSVDSSFQTDKSNNSDNGEEGLSIFSGVSVSISRFIVGALLRLGFIVIAFWPLWLLSLLLGYFAFKKFFIAKPSKTILGVCDRKKGPFYSGIHGPLRPNNSSSGTDFSCPGLACPAKEKAAIASSHKLCLLLKENNAYNETNFDLVRIILSHAGFPGAIPDETAWQDEEEESTGNVVFEAKKSEVSIITPDSIEVTLKDSALEGLIALLEARKKIGIYIDSLDKKGIKRVALDQNFSAHLSNLEKLTNSISPLAKLLIFSLTPTRLWALGHLKPEMIASAYLAIEAGKCLVFKKIDGGFTRMSNFPHLQARAVIQSLPQYHNEYNGDDRQAIRQAIICSRRHGDFGRAFLPMRMPVATRAIRDWLEILYTESEKREDSAHLVELDGHLDEIHLNWRTNLDKRVRKDEPALFPHYKDYNKGVIHKSVVLFPVAETISLALKGLHEVRLERIVGLLNSTKKFQHKLSISARLPGFKRQVIEEDTNSIVEHLETVSKGYGIKNIFSRWRIVRRMLTRYNWLSTRIGDDSVHVNGIVHGVADIADNKKIGLDAITPLRQRRFGELFGKKWDSNHYDHYSLADSLKVFVSLDKYLTFKSGNPALKSQANKNQVSDTESKKSDTTKVEISNKQTKKTGENTKIA